MARAKKREQQTWEPHTNLNTHQGHHDMSSSVSKVKMPKLKSKLSCMPEKQTEEVRLRLQSNVRIARTLLGPEHY